jgi:metallo-beta-lactamase class B
MVVLLPDNKGVLIDTPYENSGTKALLRWLSDNFGDLDLTAIVTGFHQDNLGGNEVLISKGIPVYGADLTKQLVEEEGDEFKKLIVESVRGNENKRYVEAYTDLNFTPPSITFPIKEGLKLEIGNEVFEVYFPGESHTIDNTVVYMYNRKILFGGCMLKGLMYKNPGYMGYANMAEWPKSVKKVINKYPECKIVVPGHGDFGDKEILFHTLNILEDWNSKNPQIK